MSMSITLSKRLAAAAAFVRDGAVLADIGTDHAYLPIYAVENGVAVRAVAADINDKPLASAVSNIKKHGLTDRITCILTSGFDGLDSYGITDAVIAGMGGELIASLIDASDFIGTEGFRLIIQPMTMPDAARAALFRHGFTVVGEYTLKEDGKIYTVVAADYTGNFAEADRFTLLYGDLDARKYENDAVRAEYFVRETEKYKRIIDGKKKAGIETAEEESIRSMLTERISKP